MKELIQNAVILNGTILNSLNTHHSVTYKDKSGIEWFIDGGLAYCHNNIMKGNEGYEGLDIEWLLLDETSTIQECYDKLLIKIFPQTYYIKACKILEVLTVLEESFITPDKEKIKKLKVKLGVLKRKYGKWKKIKDLTKEEINLINIEEWSNLSNLQRFILELKEEELI